MPIPTSREELVDSIHASFSKLSSELDAAGPRIGSRVCVDDWTVKDLLAVRVWWTTSLVDWVEAGQRGESPVTPAEGYRWNETPLLNAEIIRRSKRESFKSLRARLDAGVERALRSIDSLSDKELLNGGVYPWAGKLPLVRWFSINMTRQYTSARTYIRRAVKARDKACGA